MLRERTNMDNAENALKVYVKPAKKEGKAIYKQGEAICVMYDDDTHEWVGEKDILKMEDGDILSEISEEKLEGHNINVFGYQTQHFDYSEHAKEIFEIAILRVEESNMEIKKDALANAAQHLDSILLKAKERNEIGGGLLEKQNIKILIADIQLFSYNNYKSGLEISIDLISNICSDILEFEDEFMGDKVFEYGGEISEYVIVKGYDHFNNKPLYHVISKSEHNDYVGEWHNNLEDAEEELESLKEYGGEMYAKGGEIEDSNNEMLQSQLKAVKHHAEELSNIINDNTPIEAWVVGKIERAATDLSDITHYLDGAKFERGGEIEYSYFEVTHYPSNSEPYVTYEKQWVGNTKPNNSKEITKEEYEHFSKYEMGGEMADGGMMAKGGSVSSKVEELWRGYAEAVLFTEEEELDSDYTIYDFDKKTETSTKKMLANYYKKNKKAIEESGLELDIIGNDIWYTRSGQGAGFFDHSLDDEIEKKLTDGAKAMGEFPMVETYNGKVSVTGGMMAKGGKLKINGEDFSFLLEFSDKELSKRLDLVRKQKNINAKQYFSAREKGESTTKIEESGNNLDNQERAIIEARIRKNKMADGGMMSKGGLIGKKVKVGFRKEVGIVKDYDDDFVTVYYPDLGFTEKVNLKMEDVKIVEMAKGGDVNFDPKKLIGLDGYNENSRSTFDIIEIREISKDNIKVEFEYSKTMTSEKSFTLQELKDLYNGNKVNGYRVFIRKEEGGEMKWGGRVTFKEKVAAITESLNGRKVKPKYKKEYGNTYDKKEAKQAATKIVGAMVSKGKMADGGMMAKGGKIAKRWDNDMDFREKLTSDLDLYKNYRLYYKWKSLPQNIKEQIENYENSNKK